MLPNRRREIEKKIDEAITIEIKKLRFQPEQNRKVLIENLRKDCRTEAFYIATLDKELKNLRTKKYRLNLAKTMHSIVPKLYSLPLDGPLSASGIGVNVNFSSEQGHPPGNFAMGIATLTAAGLCFLSWYIEEAERQKKIRVPSDQILSEMVANFAVYLDNFVPQCDSATVRWEAIAGLLVATFNLDEKMEKRKKKSKKNSKNQTKTQKPKAERDKDPTGRFGGEWARKLVDAQKRKYKNRNNFPWHPQFPTIAELLGGT